VKTTVDIDDELLRRAKVHAAESGVTLRALIERALRHELEQMERGKNEYVLRDASVGGDGINPEFLPWHWDKVRDLIYEDRGA
jgi:ribbon-helix-helix CopG family protein